MSEVILQWKQFLMREATLCLMSEVILSGAGLRG